MTSCLPAPLDFFYSMRFSERKVDNAVLCAVHDLTYRNHPEPLVGRFAHRNRVV